MGSVLNSDHYNEERLLRQACATTWWNYQEIDQADALRLFDEAKVPDAIETKKRLEQKLASWCVSDEDRWRLCLLIANQLSLQPETQPAVERIRERVEHLCFEFARRKLGDNKNARALGQCLSLIALGQLDTPQLPQARAGYAVWQALERENRKRQPELPAKSRRPRLSTESREAVVGATKTGIDVDPILTTLRTFFSVKGRYWRKFFDRRGKEKTKKLPNFPTMRSRLVKRLLEPGTLCPYLADCMLTKGEALELAAQCIKAAHPDYVPASFDGDSLRLANQYHEQMQRRTPAQRPGYTTFIE